MTRLTSTLAGILIVGTASVAEGGIADDTIKPMPGKRVTPPTPR